jgi:hypothetical protein
MEYLVAALILLATVGYAVFIAVNIEKGKTWAVEIARAISMLDPQAMNRHLRYPVIENPSAPESEVVGEPQPDRLAA